MSDPQENPEEKTEDSVSSSEATTTLSLNEPVQKEKDAGPEKHYAHQQLWEEFLQKFQALSETEERLHLAIEFMRASLSQSGTPYFKGFWEARQLCLPLFKEALHLSSRATLWKEYRQLCDESHRLKQLLEEQSAFAVEQIDLAIDAMEKELETLEERLQNVPLIDFSLASRVLEAHRDEYQTFQRELFLLNTYASKVNGLRKELIKTEMRIRQKNKFFRRLSALGDLIFPKRKELIKQISALFLEDVEKFVSQHFSSNPLSQPLYFYRDEIKALQGIAKVLTLNTHAFTHTRAALSQCWDRVKEIEKQRKKIRAEQKSSYQESVSKIVLQIDHLSQEFASGTLSLDHAKQIIDQILDAMHHTPLGRDEKRFLRERLSEAKEPIQAKIEEQIHERNQHQQSLEKEKKGKIASFVERIDALLKDSEILSLEEIISQKDALLQEIQSSSFSKIEKQNLQQAMKPVKDRLLDRKEQSVLSLPAEDQETLQQLYQFLQQCKENRKEIKDHLEELRKVSGSSGLTFEKAMDYDQQAREEKERLEKIESSIEEIEEKIAELEG